MMISNNNQRPSQVVMGKMQRPTELETLKAKINTFRVSDLQSLVGYFGRSRNGKKQDLQNRVLEILRDNPPDINMTEFKSKINELFRIAQDETKSVQYEYYANQRHVGVRGRSIPQQSSSGGIYQNGATGGARFVNSVSFPGPSTLPSINPPPSIACNVGDSVRILSQAYDIVHSNISFRPLPFYRMKYEIAKPTILKLKANGRNTASQVFQLSFVLTCEIASAIGMSRDISKNEYPIQAQLRICAIDNNTNANNSEQQYNDMLPLGLFVRMNDKQCPLPPCTPCTRPGVEARRVPQPINVTQFMKLSPMNVNRLTINWSPETGRTFVLTLNVVEKLTSNYLLEKLKARPKIKVDETKQMIAKQYKRVIDDDDDTNADDDDDIATTIIRVSLQCPLVKFRITLPAKGKNCGHLQCFDGAAYISLNEKKSMWMCPVCNRSLYYDDLLIDQYFVDVLASEASKDCVEVQLFVDGNWKVYDEDNPSEEQSKTENETPNSPSEKLSVNSQDDGSVQIDHKDIVTDPASSLMTGTNVEERPVVSDSVVDLTEDDEEEFVPNDNVNESIDSIANTNTSSSSQYFDASPGSSTEETEDGSSNSRNPMILSPSPSQSLRSLNSMEAVDDTESAWSKDVESPTSQDIENTDIEMTEAESSFQNTMDVDIPLSESNLPCPQPNSKINADTAVVSPLPNTKAGIVKSDDSSNVSPDSSVVSKKDECSTSSGIVDSIIDDV